MVITRDENGVVTLRPGNEDEAKVMAAFFTGIPNDTPLSYAGRSDDPERPRFCCPHFSYEDRDVTILGTDEDDAHMAFQIRDLCYYGSGTAIVFTKMETDEQGLLVTLFVASLCKHCDKPCTTTVRAEWNTCPECVEKCNHEWVLGAIHGGTTKDGHALNFGTGYYCRKCGSAKPNEGAASKTLAEHHAAAIDAGIVDAIVVST